MRILLVEDDISLCKALMIHLNSRDMKPMSATTARTVFPTRFKILTMS